jgi:alkylated DNA repair dioxygenase AlkB
MTIVGAAIPTPSNSKCHVLAPGAILETRGMHAHEDLVKTIVGQISDEYKTDGTFSIYGKTFPVPRQVQFRSDVCEGYAYSGQIAKALPMTPELAQLVQVVNAEFGTEYNSVLINRYIDGNHSISPHSDDERGLDPKGGVVALSYGAERTFRIRNKSANTIVKDIATAHMHAICMRGAAFQANFTHEIPKSKRVTGERVSFSFRHHISNSARAPKRARDE